MIMLLDNVAISSSSGGIGFTGLLTIVFVTLKLCGVIAWSWSWVLFPLILSAGLFILVMLVAVILYLVC